MSRCKSNRKARIVLTLGVTAILFLPTGCGIGPSPTATSALAPFEPESGIYWGVNLDWGNDNLGAFGSRLGLPPAVAVYFVEFPVPPAAQPGLDAFMHQAASANAIALLTLEPFAGLSAVTQPVVAAFADYLAAKNSTGAKVIVRFAHEMNGSWYPWSQQPTAYKEAFRRLSSTLHTKVPKMAVVWAPNYGGGYPFRGGPYPVEPGSADFKALDTNGDGLLDMRDDPYMPYYPGDEYVDWVGMSLYHWGNTYPWGENEIPEPGVFIASLTGNYQGLDGDHTTVPDFYEEFSVKRRKPLAVTETAALYNPAAGGALELDIKRTWWRQVFAPDVFDRFPMLKMINWFEWRKFETEISTTVDWTISLNPEIRQAFIADFPHHRFILG